MWNNIIKKFLNNIILYAILMLFQDHTIHQNLQVILFIFNEFCKKLYFKKGGDFGRRGTLCSSSEILVMDTLNLKIMINYRIL